MKAGRTIISFLLAILILNCYHYAITEKKGAEKTEITFNFVTPKPTIEPTQPNRRYIPQKTKDDSQYTSDRNVYPIVISALIGCIALFLILKIERSRRAEMVKTASTRFLQIKEINNRYSFFMNEPEQYQVNYIAQSKREYSDNKLTSIIIYALTKDTELQRIYEELKENRQDYSEYSKEIAGIPQTDLQIIRKTHISPNAFLKHEDAICNEIIKTPPLNIKIIISFAYYDIMGTKHAYERLTEDYEILEDAFSRIKTEEYRQNQIRAERLRMEEYRQYQMRVERSKMSSTLRYQVLNRDGFRCTICGATAEDGVKLHVDHIKPVSKGGKTELSNLRTLCDRCNRGKSDYYNPNGLN